MREGESVGRLGGTEWGRDEERGAAWDEVAQMAMPNAEDETEAQPGETVSLAEAMADLRDKRYELLGHGTVGAELADQIMEQGLKVGGEGRDTDTDSNFCALNHDAASLTETLDHWRHKDAKQIVLFRVPVKYKLPFGLHRKETYSVFYHDEDDGRGVYERDFIYGWYDAENGVVHKNADYHGNLEDEDDVAQMEKVYQETKADFLESLPEEDRADWEDLARMYYNYIPE